MSSASATRISASVMRQPMRSSPRDARSFARWLDPRLRAPPTSSGGDFFFLIGLLWRFHGFSDRGPLPGAAHPHPGGKDEDRKGEQRDGEVVRPHAGAAASAEQRERGKDGRVAP